MGHVILTICKFWVSHDLCRLSVSHDRCDQVQRLDDLALAAEEDQLVGGDDLTPLERGCKRETKKIYERSIKI